MIGIDVSYAQATIDWSRVKAADHVISPSGRIDGPVGFAFIKATGEEIGRLFRDGRFIDNWKGARAAGVVRGAYHFMNGAAGSADGRAEADKLLEAISAAGGLAPGDLRPALDVEWPPKSGALFQIEQLTECVEAVRDALGVAPIVYTGRWYWDDITGADCFGWLDESPLWLASYTPAVPKPPKLWTETALWQFTNKGRVDGINGPVDLNRLLAPIEDLLLQKGSL